MRKLVLILLVTAATQSAIGQNQEQLLQDAYNAKSTEKLKAFFDAWARETPDITPADFQKLSDTIKDVYTVFATFYNPLDIKRSGGSEFGNDTYKKVKYLVVQDAISYRFADSLTDNDGDLNPPDCDTLRDFRPCLSFKVPPAVFLTAHYNTILNRFLGNTFHKLGEKDIMDPARAKGESAAREAFLDRLVRIFYGHWGGYWQLYSYPIINCITFNRTRTHAIVNFRMIYEGGLAKLEKVNGAWQLTEAKRTWIE